MGKYANGQMCKCENMQMGKFKDVQTCNYCEARIIA